MVEKVTPECEDLMKAIADFVADVGLSAKVAKWDTDDVYRTVIYFASKVKIECPQIWEKAQEELRRMLE